MGQFAIFYNDEKDIKIWLQNICPKNAFMTFIWRDETLKPAQGMSLRPRIAIAYSLNPYICGELSNYVQIKKILKNIEKCLFRKEVRYVMNVSFAFLTMF